MERLTEKHFGNEGYYMKCSEDCHAPQDCIDCAAFEKLVDRLAAYEDTGLEPEDIKAMYASIEKIGLPLWKLEELAKAEKDGRLVVLPCKVGDTVYKLNHGDYAHHWKPFVQEGTVTEISWKNNRSGKDLGFAIIVRFNYEARVRFKFSNIGKTVFLTREEAEAALARERKDGEG